MIAQNKGKDIQKIPTSRLRDVLYYGSTKYDGNYIQIHKTGNTIKFFTSGNKEFYLKDLADELVYLNTDVNFKIELEFIGKTSGKLGSRGDCTTTTWRTNFVKGIEQNCGENRFKLFRLISYNTGDIIIDMQADEKTRWDYARRITLPKHIESVYKHKMTLRAAKIFAEKKRRAGWEGAMLVAVDSTYLPGKRVNDIIKIKPRPTADLLCIDYEVGEGKYYGLLGSLVCQDSKGRIVCVGSGLTDQDRGMDFNTTYLDKVIEVEYEQILDTYIQPVFKGVRHDKTEKEID